MIAVILKNALVKFVSRQTLKQLSENYFFEFISRHAQLVLRRNIARIKLNYAQMKKLQFMLYVPALQCAIAL
jgi:hypothetical protein